MAQTYSSAAIGATFAANKSMLGIFNGTGSGQVLRVYRIWCLNNQTVAVTGVLTTFALRRTTAQSGGTAITPIKHDTLNVSMPAQVLVATGATATLSADLPFRTWVWSNDEPLASTASSDEWQCLIPLNTVFDATGDANIEPIVLRANEGITIQHTGSTAVGVVDLFVEYTMGTT